MKCKGIPAIERTRTTKGYCDDALSVKSHELNYNLYYHMHSNLGRSGA